ncbi:MAG: ABC transporter ATP-binding protein [Polyangiaceae bacterium]
MAAPPDLIRLDGVSKEYVSGAGVVRALKDVDLAIQPGEFVAIVGTSGSGKSTLMNILGCLDRPTHGTYSLAGLDVGARENDSRAIVRNRLIGFIFQGFNLLPRTTALENCELPLQYRGIGAAERKKRATEALEAVGLGERLDHAPNQLSGGQQQRVAIARALVTSPPLLLADEPTGNLDTRTSYEVLALLQRLNRDRGITIVLVTHERDIASCASRVITVRDGRVVSDAPPEAPVDAAHELAQLPPPNDHVGSAAADGPLDPKEERRRKLGGPVPFAVYAAAATGGILGSVVGSIYTQVVLDQSVPWIPLVFAFLGEAWLGARSGKKRTGRPLTPDQRARVAIQYTLVTLAFAAIPLAAGGMKDLPASLASRLETLSSMGSALAMGAVVLLFVSVSLLRYLLLTLFAPAPSVDAKH